MNGNTIRKMNALFTLKNARTNYEAVEKRLNSLQDQIERAIYDTAISDEEFEALISKIFITYKAAARARSALDSAGTNFENVVKEN